MKRLFKLALLLAASAILLGGWCVPARAAIARDGSVVATNCNATTCVATKTPTTGAAEFVTLSFRSALGTLTSIKDSAGDTFTIDKNIASGDGNRNLVIAHFFGVAANTSVTATFSTTLASIIILESYTGMTGSAAVDVITAAVNSSSGTAATSNSFTTTGSNDLLVGMCFQGTNSTTTWTATGGSGWTLTASQVEGTNGTSLGGEDELNKAAAAYNAAMTASASLTWYCIAGSYSDGSAAGAVAPMNKRRRYEQVDE